MKLTYRPFSDPMRWTWLFFRGSDARDFLQRLTTVDVKNLRPGQGANGFFLSPQGKIRSYFTLWALGPHQNAEYAFEFDAGQDGKWKEALLGVIDQFNFGEKIEIQEAPADWQSRWILEPKPTSASDSKELEIQFNPTKNLYVCHHGKRDFGRVWTSIWGSEMAIDSWIQENHSDSQNVSFAQLEEWRILAMQPRINSEITEAYTPLDLGMRHAVAENKGCYPGQEVVEKILSYGSPPRRLGLLQGKGTLPCSGDLLFNLAEPPVEIGHVTSVTGDSSSFHALASIKKAHAQEGVSIRFANPQSSTQGVLIQLARYA